MISTSIGRNRRLDERGRCRQAQRQAAPNSDRALERGLCGDAKEADPVLGVWRLFAALPQNEFAARAKDLQRDMTKPKDPNGGAACIRWLRGPCSAVRRRTRARWLHDTSRSLASSRRG